mmetsp:Transcript_22669/g.40810  ORF Transcript_22669/g.40810 Transcript_22669/m.40810 type:complete len:211 (-) Transcript_22669:32-664(-)
MEEVIREQVDEEDVDIIEEIVLDAWKGTSISLEDKALLETYSALNVLSVSGCGLTSLVNFPHLSNLIKLDLSKNALTGSLEHLKHCKELLQIDLSDNQIKTLAELRHLSLIPNLCSLELAGNPVADVEGYRAKLFEICESLEILDGLNVEGEEASISELDSSVVESDDEFNPEQDDSEPEDEEESLESEEEYRPKRKSTGKEPAPRKQRK